MCGLLSDHGIMTTMRQGDIVIDPFEQQQLGPNSYDVRIGQWFYLADSTQWELDLADPASIASFWQGPYDASHDGSIVIPAGQTVLCHTEEIVGTFNGYVAQMRTRSTLKRLGIDVCGSAGLGDVGYCNIWTMELHNGHRKTDVMIPLHMRVAQMVFSYAGYTLNPYKGVYNLALGGFADTYALARIRKEWTPQQMLPSTKKAWDADRYEKRQEVIVQ